MRLNFSVLQFLRDTVGSNEPQGVWKTCHVEPPCGTVGWQFRMFRKFGIHEQQNMLTIQIAEFLLKHLTIDGLDVPFAAGHNGLQPCAFLLNAQHAKALYAGKTE